MTRTRREIVDEANLLVDKIDAKGGVKRTVWSSILADFMASPGEEIGEPRGKLQTLMAQLKKGNGGHLARNPREYKLAVAEIEAVLAEEDHTLEELRLLFGWTGRLLHAGPGPDTVPDIPRRQQEPKAKGAGLGEKNLGVLQALQERFKSKN